MQSSNNSTPSTASSTNQAIQFWLNGSVVSVNDAHPHQSLLQWLRQDPQRCGTKEGCAEGDCGACTVLMIEDLGDQQPLQVKPINSCIRLLPTLQGKAIVTVEGLSDINAPLHPAQQAMVDHHGSQCGFCTPGFVMSLAGLYKKQSSASRDDVCAAIAGNLCRCTGYKPILDAAQQMMVIGRDDNSSAELRPQSRPAWQQWLQQIGQTDQHTGAAQVRAALASIPRTNPRYAWDGYTFLSPSSAAQVSQLLANYPSAWILAGGTDVGLWINKALQLNRTIIWLGAAQDLNHIRTTDTHLEIGAAVATTQAFDALNKLYPKVADVWLRFASIPVRNSATLCGNIANGSPIGDSMPVLISLGATVQLDSVDGARTIPLEDLYLEYKKQSRAPNEWVHSVHIPLPRADHIYAAYKLSKRPEQDISAVLCAISMTQSAGVITSARIAFGGMAGTPKRARAAEAALLNQRFNKEAFEAAALALATDFTPLSDMRATQMYRSKVAANCLRRFWLENSLENSSAHRLKNSASQSVDHLAVRLVK